MSYPFLNELVGTNQYLWNAALAQVKKSFSVDVSAGSRFIKNIFFAVRCLSAGMEFVSWAVPQWEYRRRILNDSD